MPYMLLINLGTNDMGSFRSKYFVVNNLLYSNWGFHPHLDERPRFSYLGLLPRTDELQHLVEGAMPI
jgi:hypothetical protein